jgi:hypothetical protein
LWSHRGPQLDICVKDGASFHKLGDTIVQCVRKVAVHLQMSFEIMSTSVYTGLSPINFIHKHFLQICVRKVAVHL